MTFLLANLGLLLVLLILLGISALFAGSETALFSLSRHDRQRLRKSSRRSEVLAASLLDNSRTLLIAILVGNMSCNILIFVLSTQVLHNVQENYGSAATAAMALLPALAVTLVSEVLPKIFARYFQQRLAALVAPPLAVLMRLVGPAAHAIERAVMVPAHRLVGTKPKRTGFDTDEFRELLEMSESQGIIDVSENELLQEVVRLSELRVRDVMTPRVDVVAFDLKEKPEHLLRLIRQSGLSKLPVFEGQIDNVLGVIYAKTLLLEANPRTADLRKLIRPVLFVPESQRLDRLLTTFRQSKVQMAMVVDEYGGLVGLVALEDVIEQMVGDIATGTERDRPPVEKVGPNDYLVAGDLSVVDWADAFGSRVDQRHTSTVAGLLSLQLKRLPKTGDQVQWEHLLMTVESMRGRRVERVRLTLIDPSKAGDVRPDVLLQGEPHAS